MSRDGKAKFTKVVGGEGALGCTREGKGMGSIGGLLNEGTKEDADALRGRVGDDIVE